MSFTSIPGFIPGFEVVHAALLSTLQGVCHTGSKRLAAAAHWRTMTSGTAARAISFCTDSEGYFRAVTLAVVAYLLATHLGSCKAQAIFS